MNRNDFSILLLLNEFKCTDQINALSIKQIEENTQLSNSKIRYTIKELVAQGYLKEGLMCGNASTYYLSTDGITFLDTIKNTMPVRL